MYVEILAPGLESVGVEWITVGEPEVQKQRGKWVVRQAGHDPVTGRRRVKQLATLPTRRAATRYRASVLAGRAGTGTETVGQFLEQVWLPLKKGRVETSSLDQYSWAVRRHVVPLVGAVRLCDFTVEVADDWVTALTAVNNLGKPRLGPTSARLVRKVLSMAMEEAVQRGRLARNPMVLTPPPKPDRDHKKLGWTLEEARTFLAAASGHRLYAAFHLSLVTGLRRGEILGLRWSDVDLLRRQLEVAQQLSVERGRPVIKQLETARSTRAVSFGAATAKVLAAHRTRQESEAESAGPAWKDSGLVVTTVVGGWVDPNNFRRLMDSLIEAAGVPRITPKGLRHTAQAVGRVVVGDHTVMQERLGHADIGSGLGTITHTVTDQHREAGDRLDEVFS